MHQCPMGPHREIICENFHLDTFVGFGFQPFLWLNIVSAKSDILLQFFSYTFKHLGETPLKLFEIYGVSSALKVLLQKMQINFQKFLHHFYKCFWNRII